MDYQEKIRQLYRRKNNVSDFSESHNKQENGARGYIDASMKEIDESYREKTKEAAIKVINRLTEFDCEFQLQGSVTTQTEIVQASDIDLVVNS